MIDMKMKQNSRRRTTCFPDLRGGSGFTLIELVLATTISALVIGILSVCLSFSLRAWESTQNRKPDQSAALVDLIKWQLAEFDPTPIRFTEGPRAFFTGSSRSIAFATTHSVKAISQGVPVIARYSYDPKTKTLFYSELPLDPYHPRAITEFTRAKIPGGEKDRFRFYGIEMQDFTLAYGQKDKEQLQETWRQEDGADNFPRSVLLGWTAPDGRKFSQLLLVNSPFNIKIDPAAAAAAGAMGRRVP